MPSENKKAAPVDGRGLVSGIEDRLRCLCHAALDAFATGAAFALAFAFSLTLAFSFAVHGSGTGFWRVVLAGCGLHAGSTVGKGGGDGNRERGGDECDECFLHGALM